MANRYATHIWSPMLTMSHFLNTNKPKIIPAVVPIVPPHEDDFTAMAAAPPMDTPAAPAAPSKAPAIPPTPSICDDTSTIDKTTAAVTDAPKITVPPASRATGPPIVAPKPTWQTSDTKNPAEIACTEDAWVIRMLIFSLLMSCPAKRILTDMPATSCPAWTVSTEMANVANIPMHPISIQSSNAKNSWAKTTCITPQLTG